MDTVKINRGNTRLIAHRGLSGIECENTAAAFVAAANRGYYGIETDLHKTSDGSYILFHDDRTGRLSDRDLAVEKTDLATLRSLSLFDRDGKTRCDLCIPTLEEYLHICRKYEKIAVLELKNRFTKTEIEEILKICQNAYFLKNIIFISFEQKNLVELKQLYPAAQAQFLCNCRVDKELINMLKKNGFDLDIHYERLDEAAISLLHQNGILVNCWTCDSKAQAEKLVSYGVDFITTNILE